MLIIHHFLRGPLGNNMFLLADEATSRAAIVDPGIESEDLLDFANERGWKIELIINTHAHFDHVYRNGWYAQRTDAPIALHADDLPLLRNLQETCQRWGIPVPDASPEPAILLEHGVALDVLGHALEVRHTPGHSPGQVALVGSGALWALSASKGLRPEAAATETAAIALVGDTLFRRGVGRWDLPGANFEQLERSITAELYSLPDETLVLCGHGDFTTIGEEKRLNPFVGAGARLLPKV